MGSAELGSCAGRGFRGICIAVLINNAGEKTHGFSMNREDDSPHYH